MLLPERLDPSESKANAQKSGAASTPRLIRNWSTSVLMRTRNSPKSYINFQVRLKLSRPRGLCPWGFGALINTEVDQFTYFIRPISRSRWNKNSWDVMGGYFSPAPRQDSRQVSMASGFGCMKNGIE